MISFSACINEGRLAESRQLKWIWLNCKSCHTCTKLSRSCFGFCIFSFSCFFSRSHRLAHYIHTAANETRRSSTSRSMAYFKIPLRCRSILAMSTASNPLSGWLLRIICTRKAHFFSPTCGFLPCKWPKLRHFSSASSVAWSVWSIHGHCCPVRHPGIQVRARDCLIHLLLRPHVRHVYHSFPPILLLIPL